MSTATPTASAQDSRGQAAAAQAAAAQAAAAQAAAAQAAAAQAAAAQAAAAQAAAAQAAAAQAAAAQAATCRLLLVDDNPAIHDDVRKILAPKARATAELDALESALFDTPETQPAPTAGGCEFRIDSAYQGKEALTLVETARAEDDPYAVAVVDMRMPPGWDGLETIERLWRVEPDLHVVICTAFSDYSWSETVARLGVSDQLLILKKPFETVELAQMTHALAKTWALTRANRDRLAELDRLVEQRTAALAAVNDELRREIAERERVEAELRHAQKMEAVGQLAAGIAHEINTPVQYVGDSAYFLRESFSDLQTLGGIYRHHVERLIAGHADDSEAKRLRDELAEAERQADLEFINEQVPAAFDSVREGVERIASIVRAMKNFAYDGGSEPAEADLNRALTSTIEVSRHEHKTVAKVVTDFAELPPIKCHVGDLNQVFLNLIVNACHAIEATARNGEKGTIRIATAVADGWVTVSVADTGGGIPEAVRERVFEPFFTTKEVGKGSGQGLAIAHSIVVDKHGGSIDFADDPGGGTVFTIRLPVAGRDGNATKALARRSQAG